MNTDNIKLSINQLENELSQNKGQKQGVDIIWHDVKYTATTQAGSNEILKGLSGICKQGEMTAIMGSSGAGKTTLLNILCCRSENTSQVKLSGQISANGQAFDARSFSNFAAYVMQEDLIMETMTVLEALQFAANLKMTGTQQQKNAKVQEVLKIMRLEKCKHTLIGGQNVQGITKGEKKRTSIAFELVSDPDVIFLDEPTSGLDSFTAYNVIDVLKQYAQSQNKTIICTIHQPSSEIFIMFDRLILLVGGRFIYQGPRNNVIEYFASFGFACPQLSNPADYFMSIMHAESEKNRKNYQTYFDNFDKELKPKIEKEILMHSTLSIVNKSTNAPFMTQLKNLTVRSFLNMKRNQLLFKSRIAQSIILGLFTGIVYSKLSDPEDHPDDQRLLNDYNGALFFLAVNNHMNTVLPIVLTLPSERTVFIKEENSKMYGVTAYFFSKFIVETITTVLAPVIFSSISYFMIGLNSNFTNFCFFLLVSIILSFVASAQGMFCGSLFRDPGTAINVTPLMIIPFMLFGGFYKNSDDMPSWNRWIQWLSPYRYGFEAYARNNYEDTPFNIDPVEQLKFNLGKWESLLILFCLFIGYQTIALLFLMFNKKRMQ